MTFYIVSAILCITQICLLIYQTIVIARVRQIHVDMATFDWKTLMALEADMGVLKTMVQKVNGRISGMGNSKYDLVDEIKKGLKQPAQGEYLDG
jgi:hypothetical protein